jgi:threonine dehydrogenase-like Zn-dependent dehydrogenase
LAQSEENLSNKLTRYRAALDPLPATYNAWPLYGAGLLNLGYDHAMTVSPRPEPGPDQILVRNDAAGLCFSDVKVIQMGAGHPRLTGRDLAVNPLVPGHEASVTVVAVGAGLTDRYCIGQRFAVQPDIWCGGKSLPYGYSLDGAFQQYGLIGREILAGDAGSYLVPIPDAMTYAAAALTEPWACVEASYRAPYRTALKSAGRAWFVGVPGSRDDYRSRYGYRLDTIWCDTPPSQVVLTDVPADLAERLRGLCHAGGVGLTVADLDEVLESDLSFDDILLLDPDAETVDAAARQLARGGVLAIARPDPLSRPIAMDLGRLHYDNIVYVGTTGLDLDAAYQGTPVRAPLQPGGTAWIAGAGGAMGRMHVQRALESIQPPSLILATEVSAERADDLLQSFSALAEQRGSTLAVLNPQAGSRNFAAALAVAEVQGGIHDVQVLAADPDVVVEATHHLAPGGVVNLFAGLKRGTTASINAWLIYGPAQIRLFGHSGSGLDDQIAIVERAAAGYLAPERCVSAIGGLRQAPDGLEAMLAATYPGKIVVYPAVPDFPLTALPDLRDVLPDVYAKLADGRTWTSAAEDAFLEAMLPA